MYTFLHKHEGGYKGLPTFAYKRQLGVSHRSRSALWLKKKKDFLSQELNLRPEGGKKGQERQKSRAWHVIHIK